MIIICNWNISDYKNAYSCLNGSEKFINIVLTFICVLWYDNLFSYQHFNVDKSCKMWITFFVMQFKNVDKCHKWRIYWVFDVDNYVDNFLTICK